MYGGWVTWDQTEAHVLDYGFVFEADCDRLPTDGAGNANQLGAVTAAPLPEGVRSTSDFLVYNAELVTGIQCDRAQVDAANPAWTPAVPPMPATYVTFAIDVVPAPEGGLSDFWLDSDGDGIEEEFSATVTVDVYDAGITQLCTMVFEADTATEIVPTSYTAIDAFGAPSGPLWRAWSLTLTDGDSTDCRALDPATFGTNNLSDLLSGVPFGFGIGQMNDLAAAGPAAWGASWTTYEPLLYSVYLSFDGGNAVELAYGLFGDVNDCLVVDPALGVYPREYAQDGRVGNLVGIPYYLVTL